MTLLPTDHRSLGLRLPVDFRCSHGLRPGTKDTIEHSPRLQAFQLFGKIIISNVVGNASGEVVLNWFSGSVICTYDQIMPRRILKILGGSGNSVMIGPTIDWFISMLHPEGGKQGKVYQPTGPGMSHISGGGMPEKTQVDAQCKHMSLSSKREQYSYVVLW